jgi:hypothetical protein
MDARVSSSIEIATDDYGRWPAADRPVDDASARTAVTSRIDDEVVVGEVEAVLRSTLLAGTVAATT